MDPVLTKLGSRESPTDVITGEFDPGQKKLQVVSYEKWGNRTNELVQIYNKLIMREDR
jgi:hypothetical protein